MKKITKALLSTFMILSILILSTSSILAKEEIFIKVEEEDIAQRVQNDGKFTTLFQGLQATGLVDTLKGDGPFTVFAPTDEAFQKLPANTLADLLKPENKNTLSDILLYHVSNGNLNAEDITKLNGKEITMENGKNAKITVENGEVFIDNAKIITADIQAKNGIIHVIDTVLQPE